MTSRATYQREWYHNNIESERARKRKRYQETREIKLKQAHERYLKNPNKIKAYGRKYSKEYYYIHRGERQTYSRSYAFKHQGQIAKYQALYRAKNKDKLSEYFIERRLRIKEEVLRHYSPELKCQNLKCAVKDGERRIDRLELDHVNDDGAKHRNLIRRGKVEGVVLYTWLKKNNYPPEYVMQVFCSNCNHIKEVERKEAKWNSIIHSLESERRRKYDQRLRLDQLFRYSPNLRCLSSLCTVEGGMGDIRTLSFQHIKHGGTKHKKEIGGSTIGFYQWLKRNPVQLDITVFCMSCQREDQIRFLRQQTLNRSKTN